MKFTDALELLKAVHKEAEDISNVERANKDAKDSSDKFFKVFDKKFFNKQIHRLNLINILSMIRLSACVLIIGLTLYSIFTHSEVLPFVVGIISVLTLSSITVSLLLEREYYKDETAYSAMEKEALLRMFYYSNILDARKCYIIKNVYEKAYEILEELSKNPEIDKEIKMIKDEKGIDFSFLTEDINFLEQLEKQYEQIQE
jgi:hypothetical protein